jgi:hypothetical protein
MLICFVSCINIQVCVTEITSSPVGSNYISFSIYIADIHLPQTMGDRAAATKLSAFNNVAVLLLSIM